MEQATKRKTYRIEEVAEQLGISRAKAYQAAKEGKIPCLPLWHARDCPRRGLRSDARGRERGCVDDGVFRKDQGMARRPKGGSP